MYRAVGVKRLLLVMTGAIFAVELAIMLMLHPLLMTLPGPEAALLDGLALILILYPVLYLVVYRPFLSEINRREQAEEALRASEANYRGIFDAANDAIFVHDPETGAILDANRKTTEMYGYTREEILGLTVADLSAGTPPCSQREALEWVRKAAREGPQVFEWLARDRSGRQFWVEVNLKCISIGGRERLLAIVRDITERKRVQEELLQKTSELEAVFQALPDLYFRVDSRGTYLDYRAGRAADLYASPEKFMGKTMRDVLPPDVAGMLEQTIDCVLETKAPATVEYSLPMPQGEQAFELRMLPFDEGQVVAVVRNITERKQAEAERERLLAQLRETNAQREDYVHMISHDLRGPLTPVMGQAGWLQRKLAEKGMEREAAAAETIVKNAQRMNSMIQELVESARLESPALELHREATDLCELVGDVLRRVGSIEDRPRIKMQCAEGVGTVLVDPDRIERVIVNLVTNALKYSPRDRPVVTRVEPRDGEVVVSVADQGVGISPEELLHLFQRFHRFGPGKQAGSLGLGLYISRLIVDAHGGRIWAESEPGKGSTFSFALPLRAP